MTPCRKADRALRDSRFAEAHALYEQAAAAGDLRAWFGLGWMAEKGCGQPPSTARALECYEKGATGDAQSAFNLAAHLALGAGGEGRKTEVLGWYQRALELGHAKAMARIALVLHDGLGVTKDEQRADELCRRAIWEGDPSARLFLGRWLAERGDIVAAARQFLEAHVEGARGLFAELEPILGRLRQCADQGDGEAQYLVGVRHLLAREPDEGMRWIRNSAERGNPAGLRALGYAHDTGEGAAADPERARHLYEQAAAAGDAQAQYNVAVMLLDQADQPDALARAQRLLEQSASQGNGPALKRLGLLLVDDAPERAREWLRLSAQRGQAAAMIAFGKLLRDGKGGPVDLVQAARWFITALRHGNGDGVHEMHGFVARMQVDEIRAAARLAGDLEEAEAWIALRERTPP